jgi:hypothetical protein
LAIAQTALLDSVPGWLAREGEGCSTLNWGRRYPQNADQVDPDLVEHDVLPDQPQRGEPPEPPGLPSGDRLERRPSLASDLVLTSQGHWSRQRGFGRPRPRSPASAAKHD